MDASKAKGDKYGQDGNIENTKLHMSALGMTLVLTVMTRHHELDAFCLTLNLKLLSHHTPKYIRTTK